MDFNAEPEHDMCNWYATVMAFTHSVAASCKDTIVCLETRKQTWELWIFDNEHFKSDILHLFFFSIWYDTLRSFQHSFYCVLEQIRAKFKPDAVKNESHFSRGKEVSGAWGYNRLMNNEKHQIK